jgi:hypothetical protein
MKKSHIALVALVFACPPALGVGPSSFDAIQLDGLSGHASGTFDLDFDAFTVEAWVKVASVTQGNSAGGSIMTYGRGGSQTFSFWLIPPSSGAELVSPRLQINFSNGPSRITPHVPDPIPFGVWTHVAASYDDQTARIYINGELVVEEVWDVTVNLLPGGVLVLGREFPGLSEWLGGELDEVRLWSRVRGEGEIQSSINTTVCSDDEDLFAYYPFDGDAGDNVTDATGSGRDLALLGSASNIDADAPIIPATNCVPCSIADQALPYGELNFFDVSAFISVMPDLNMDGGFDFFDVSVFLTSYSMGCP